MTLSSEGWALVVILGILAVMGVIYWYIKKREARGVNVIATVKGQITDEYNDIAEKTLKMYAATKKVHDAVKAAIKENEEKKA